MTKKPSRRERILKNQRMRKQEMRKTAPICESCGCEIFFNLELCKDFGMCGTCITGEARYNYEEVTD